MVLSQRAASKKTRRIIPELPATPSSATGEALGLRLIGANSNPQVSGLEQLPAVANYFIGNQARKWRTGIPTYQKVKYAEVYPGVDLIYYGREGELEYDFIVAPGAHPEAIGLAFNSVTKVKVDEQGDLILSTAHGEIRQRKPL